MVVTKEHDTRLMVLCFDVGVLPEKFQFGLLSCGALLSAIGFAFLQEAAYNVPGFKFGGFMGLLTSWTFCACAALERVLRGDLERKGSLKDYLLLSVFTASGIYFTNWSLNYINYPMRVMFKSSKLIPTMVVGVFIVKRSYGWKDYAVASLLVIGIICFAMADSRGSPKFDIVGVFLISIGVIADAVTSNFEEQRFFRTKSCSHEEVICFSFFFGSIWTFLTIYANGSLAKAYAHAQAHPQIYPIIIWSSIGGYFSVTFILLLIKRFGATVAEAVKSVRKVLTIIVSFVVYAKPVTSLHVIGFLFFVLSIVGGMHLKMKQKSKGAATGASSTQPEYELVESQDQEVTHASSNTYADKV